MNSRLLCLVALSSAAALAGCSESDLAYLTETGTYSDQTLEPEYLDCPTGQIEVQRAIVGGQARERAINHTEHRVGVNFQSRFGGGNQFYADPGQATETLWRSPVDAQGTHVVYECEVDG